MQIKFKVLEMEEVNVGEAEHAYQITKSEL